jgi:hypothetical protein
MTMAVPPRSVKPQFLESVFGDLSLWSLLLSNAITIYLAVQQGWNLSVVIWIYWFQNIIIGGFNFIRILQQEDFSTDGFLLNGRPLPPTQASKNKIAFFFLLHYGLFHVRQDLWKRSHCF